MNNKGVTLIELLIVIVVMGIISAFAIPAVGTIIENTQKDSVYNDALLFENAAKMYCIQNSQNTECDGTVGRELTWAMLGDFMDSFDESQYTLLAATVIATDSANGWVVSLDGFGDNGGLWDFTAGVPSASNVGRANVVVDDND